MKPFEIPPPPSLELTPRIPSDRTQLVEKTIQPLLEGEYGQNQDLLDCDGLVGIKEVLICDMVKYRRVTFNEILEMRTLKDLVVSYACNLAGWCGAANSRYASFARQ